MGGILIVIIIIKIIFYRLVGEGIGEVVVVLVGVVEEEVVGILGVNVEGFLRGFVVVVVGEIGEVIIFIIISCLMMLVGEIVREGL